MSWPLVRIGEVATVNPRLSKDVDESQEVSFLAMASVSEDGSIIEQEARVLSETKKGFTYFERGDVLLAKITPCFENGKAVCVSELNTQIGFGSTEFHVIRPNAGVLNPKYIFYMIWNKRFRFYGERAMSGAAGQKRIPTDFVKGYEIPLPYPNDQEKSLKKQKRIVAILDKADAIRRKRDKAALLADELLRSVFIDMFGDPVANSKGWPTKPLKELASKIGSGATPRGGKDAYVDEGISLIRSLNVHDNKFLYKDLAYITDDQASRLANVVVEPIDILLNITGASVCRCSMVDENILPARVNQHVCIIRPAGISGDYLLHMLISPPYKNYLLNLSGAGGATREALTKDQVENLVIPIPPEGLQDKFSNVCRILKAMSQKSKLFSELPLLYSLSQKAFSGEL